MANDPPWVGADDDRSLRKGESYVKDFIPMDLGTIRLDKGKSRLTLSALEIPGKESIEMRLVMLNRVP